ncbi:VanZ family protein [Streptomyces sp. H34-S4]|uniref:VanZ family protein n=1 Tax=Streptomyces sp. H34-S4 TaxID=2996463 RepID=UPI00226DFC18|nr:VanZ family protein [Streptomyces sp. H34-S4]MCY0933899.1 VanZ family protein [Streptomyces sp. H34-S4]
MPGKVFEEKIPVIEASIDAVPGLLLAFFILASMLCIPAGLIARRKGKRVTLYVLLSASVAGIGCVTLIPGLAGDAGKNVCDIGFSLTGLNRSAWLNLALFVPASLFSVLCFRKPALAGTFGILSSALIEVAQTDLVAGRSCSLTDFIMNSVGATAGAALGVLWLALRGGETRFQWVRDAKMAGALALTGAFVFVGTLTIWRPDLRDAVQADHDVIERSSQTQDAAEWIGQVGADIFGPESKAKGIHTVKRDNGWLVSAETEMGTVDGIWPEKKITSVLATNNEAESGSLSAQEASAAGQEFANRWFASEVRGSSLAASALKGSTGSNTVYGLTYRRYVNGVMMPMRLDIAVTSAGRILNATGVPQPDPRLPTPVLTREDAEERVRRSTGQSATGAVLLAQKISGEWRPVWMIGMPDGAKEPDIFVDAETGATVRPDPLPGT